MKKFIYFLFIVFFGSLFSFAWASYPIYQNHSEYPENALIGQDILCSAIQANGRLLNPSQYFPNDFATSNAYKSTDYCHAIGWITQSKAGVDVAGFQYPSYYYYIYAFSPAVLTYDKCPDGFDPYLLTQESKYVSGGNCCHSICVSDFSASGNNPYTDDTCLPLNTAETDIYYTLLACKTVSSPALIVSEKTKQTENSLITETNSKLGSIASSNATNTSLLTQISSILKVLLSRDFRFLQSLDFISSLPNRISDSNVWCGWIDGLATCKGLGSSSDFYNSSSSSSSSSLSTGVFDLSSITPIFSGNSAASCPLPVVFVVFGHAQHFSYDSFCTFAVRIHSLVIAFARLAAAWIVFGAL